MLAIAAACCSAAGSASSEWEGKDDCYDAIVMARVAREIPSVQPDCDGCIVMVWPWFVELDVKRVFAGKAPKGKLLTLAMLHTYRSKPEKMRKHWLRLNSEGGFNYLRVSERDGLLSCPANAKPMKAYLRPGPGETMDEILAEGLARYGKRP